MVRLFLCPCNVKRIFVCVGSNGAREDAERYNRDRLSKQEHPRK